MRGSLTLKILLPIAVLVLLLIIFWSWDWFIPLVDSQASAAIGRKVTIQHLHIQLGRVTTVRATGVQIANPDGFPASDPQFVTADALVIRADIVRYITHQLIDLPLIELDHPVISVREHGTDKNYTLAMKSGGGGGKPPELGDLVINNGAASVILPSAKSNFDLTIATQPAPADSKLFKDGEIVVGAKGTYAAAPITGKLIGGALLTLRDKTAPYPVDLHLDNGSTTVSLNGTIDDPANFAGAHLKLVFAGQNMANLYQLTGVPIPATPPFRLSGNLDYANSAFRFENFEGRVGSSDLEGTITEAPGEPRRTITANLTSHQVNLADLAGFLGGTPGTKATPGQDAATKAEIAKADARPGLLPTTPINLPKINIANVDLRYRGEHIINKDVPFDNVVVHLIVKDGRITVDPLNFAVGTGTIASSFDLNPVEKHDVALKANIDFRKLQLARLMKATHAFAGDGTIAGGVDITGTGDSVATLLGAGNGHASVYLQNGGDVSALLVDLAGLQVGDAVLSALGVPNKTVIQCLIGDFALNNGLVTTKTFLVATSEANILGKGTVNLANQTLALALSTQATHFQIGALSTPINIGGTLKHPSVLPAAGPLAAKAGGAVALGILFPPLALIPFYLYNCAPGRVPGQGVLGGETPLALLAYFLPNPNLRRRPNRATCWSRRVMKAGVEADVSLSQ
jgi:uncharacterized protein involved in outer membrane biogenesis